MSTSVISSYDSVTSFMLVFFICAKISAVYLEIQL